MPLKTEFLKEEACQGRWREFYPPVMDTDQDREDDQRRFVFNRCSDCREWMVIYPPHLVGNFTPDTTFEEVLRTSYQIKYEKGWK